MAREAGANATVIGLGNDAPDAGWRLARPSLAEETPDYAIVNLVSDADGVEDAFFWDTNVDLANGEDDVRLRFTPVDPSVEGPPTVTDVFRVDNNAAPLSSIEDQVLPESTDFYGGIPIPFVDVSGLSALELLELAADPDARATYRICTEVERWKTGRITPAGPDAVRLTHIAEEGSTLLANGIAGRTMQVLRPTLPLRPLSANWTSAPVTRPVGVELEIADLDEDGDLDVAVACMGCIPGGPFDLDCPEGFPARTLVFLQSRAGAIDPVPLVVGDPEQSRSLVGVSSGDLDGDGALDFLATTGGIEQQFALMVGTLVTRLAGLGGYGQLSSQTTQVGAQPATNNARAMITADLDGDLDAAVVYEAAINVSLQVAPGVYAAGPDIPLPVDTLGSGLALGDLDGDGDGSTDLVESQFSTLDILCGGQPE